MSYLPLGVPGRKNDSSKSSADKIRKKSSDKSSMARNVPEFYWAPSKNKIYTPLFGFLRSPFFKKKYKFRPSPPPPLFQSRPSPFLVPDPRSFWLSGMSSYRLCSLTNQNAEFHAAANQIPTFRVLNQSHSFPGRTDEKRGQ